MAVVGVIRADLVANTAKFSRGIGRGVKDLGGLRAQSEATSATIGRLKTAVLGFVTAAAIIGGFRSMANAANDFQKAMAGSQAIMGRVSGQLSSQMQAAALKVARDTVFSGKEAAGAYYFLASAGMDAQQSIAALPQVARFAQAGMFDLAQATDLLTDAQSALGLSVKDPARNLANLTRVSDVLVKANTLANASVQQFSEALTNKAGAAARSVGKDVEETVAVLAAFADQGTKGAEAGTGFSIVMRDLQTKALENAEAFRNSGIAVYDSAGEMRNLADIIGDLEGRLGGMSDAQQKAEMMMLGFSDKSVAYIQTLLGMSDKIREYEKALRSAAGVTDEVAEKQWTKFTKAMNTLKAAAEQLAVVLGTPLLNGIAGVINGFTGLDPKIRRVIVGTAGFTAGMVLTAKILPIIVRLVKAVAVGLRAIAKGEAIVQALGGPAGWAALAGGLAVAAGAVYAVDQAFKDLDATQQKVAANTRFTDLAAQSAKELADAIGGSKLSSATDQAAEGMKQLGTKAAEGVEAATKEIARLREEIATVGMTEQEKVLRNLKAGGAGAAQLEEIARLQEKLGLIEKLRSTQDKLASDQAGRVAAFNANFDGPQKLIHRGSQEAYATERRLTAEWQKVADAQQATIDKLEEIRLVLEKATAATDETYDL